MGDLSHAESNSPRKELKGYQPLPYGPSIYLEHILIKGFLHHKYTSMNPKRPVLML